jgi:hypothetical protein
MVRALLETLASGSDLAILLKHIKANTLYGIVLILFIRINGH